MAVKKFSTINKTSPILLPPTALTLRIMESDTHSSIELNNLTVHGVVVSANVSGTAYAEALNVTGSGVIQFLGVNAHDNDACDPAKFKVVLDGVTVFEDTNMSVFDTRMHMLVGGFFAGGSALVDDQGIFFEKVPFNESLVVSIAGDGVDHAVLMYSYYLT